VIIDAAKKSAVFDPATIQRRNKATDQLLTANKLRSIDAVGDGNCLYRALSVGLRGDKSQHFKLRQDTAHLFSAKFQVIFGVSSLTATDKDSIHQRARVLATDKEEVGEEAIIVAADLLQGNIEVFTSSAKQLPLIHEPTPRCACYQPLLKPLRIAFYEPGHYRAVAELHLHMPAPDSSPSPLLGNGLTPA
jgi:hypothetical protein